ncbi:MAG TPA: hypothetical protein P5055_21225, partial [Candidatus Paceibacterota bacterium]|nr:hypothetical protein [Candidatus Paceibacterota bacterium]
MTANRQTEEPQAATWSRKLGAGTSRSCARVFSAVVILAVFGFGTPIVTTDAGEPAPGTTKSVE